MTTCERFIEQTLAALEATVPRWSNKFELIRSRLHLEHHGDMPRWRSALDSLAMPQSAEAALTDAVVIRANTGDSNALREALQALHPWRKGPFHIDDLHIDTEWRSDWKWRRLEPHLPDLTGSRVLDVGCGNGYYGWRLLGRRVAQVIGVDPTLLFVMQHAAISHLIGSDTAQRNLVLPLSLEDAPPGAAEFDVVMSMGVLYHRRDQQEHLESLRAHLKPGGLLVLETLVTPDNTDLIPDGRYARMRNVWCVNGVAGLIEQINSLGFEDAQCADISVTTSQEQRSTDWMRFESLEQCLDTSDSSLTIEGHPAPRRAIILAHKLAESAETS